MKTRNSIRSDINAMYRNKVISWLSQHVRKEKIEGFPCRVYLGAPTRDEVVLAQKDEFLKFCSEWKSELSAGKVDFLKKKYPGLEEVDVPVHLVFDTPDEIATWAGHLVEYHCSLARLDMVQRELPDLIDAALDNIHALNSFEENDFRLFVSVSKWICQHRNSGSMIRQIPVRGVDNAWFERHRTLLLAFLKDKLRLDPMRRDLLQIGLVPPAALVRVVLLDSDLRYNAGGLRYFAAPVEDLAKLDIYAKTVMFIEDVSTALSLPDMPGKVAIITPSHSLGELCRVKWIANSHQCLYFGSIDLRSFAILNNIRVYLPNTESCFMDQQTMAQNQDLWSHDDISAQDLPMPMALNQREMSMYRMLAAGVFGPRARLDLQKIPLQMIFDRIGVNSGFAAASADHLDQESFTPSPLPLRDKQENSIFESSEKREDKERIEREEREKELKAREEIAEKAKKEEEKIRNSTPSIPSYEPAHSLTHGPAEDDSGTIFSNHNKSFSFGSISTKGEADDDDSSIMPPPMLSNSKSDGKGSDEEKKDD
ncbi:MAG: hypothetical protein J5934_02610 [Succinivibrio sp.]|nr:hypothetical protein [Succinivibrio sp.]